MIDWSTCKSGKIVCNLFIIGLVFLGISGVSNYFLGRTMIDVLFPVGATILYISSVISARCLRHQKDENLSE